MIAIIAEKPGVGREIARVLGAHEKHNGYMQGGGYIVTWAFGHLLQLAPPEAYGRKRSAELPFIPEQFKLVPRDKAASRQLGVIRRVLRECDGVIAATDAGHEGELIFRTIYNHLGCTLPVRRLWISSLTEEAIERGLREMRDGAEYDRLHLAADCRAKADWLVGINASAALAQATGKPDSSLGRVQTFVLAMIASRWLEHRGFLPTGYWSLSVTLGKGDALRKFRYLGDIKDPTAIETRLKSACAATITRVERKRVHEAPPLLFDLTELQKECNVHHAMTAEQTLNAAQSLYEKRLISYPRTGSRHIPPEMEPQIPSLLKMILRMDSFAHLTTFIDPLKPSRRSVDGSKVTDHHALIITGNYAGELTTSERQVYEMICSRMLEAFGPRCEKETLPVEATVGDMLFRSCSEQVISAGWREVCNRPEEPDEYGDDIGAPDVEFTEGDTLAVMGHSLSKCKTPPKPLFTEATLLTAMEERDLGTPATRASIIETLLRCDYIERSGKSLIPTGRGVALYRAVKDLRIADAELTAGWERSLATIESGTMKSEKFMSQIAEYTRKITTELLSLDPRQPPKDAIICPKCGKGHVVIRHRLAGCDNDDCGLVVRRRFLNKNLTELHLRQLLTTGKTRLIKGFRGKAGKTFDARLTFDKNFNLTFHK